MRHYSFLDKCLFQVDKALQTLANPNVMAQRPNPASTLEKDSLNKSDQKKSAALMRVNHAGEIAAQALYHGQAFVAREKKLEAHLLQAANDEGDHLAWCKDRITELHSHVSYLSPVWYAGSFLIGILAGLAGDKISLGFVAETEHQVEAHLKSHLSQLPKTDHKSRKILHQMAEDEKQHAHFAKKSGGVALPTIIRKLMKFTSGIMTRTAYFV